MARGYFKLKDYHAVIESLPPTLRNERTKKEGQHLLAFALLQTLQKEQAASALLRSITFGNDIDWQPLVELCIENPELKLS